MERTTMADATRHNDIVARLRMFAAAVVLLARLRAAAAVESPAAQRCPFAYPSYREAAHSHLAKVFDRAGFDTRRGSMWFTKGDDVSPDCETCGGRVNPAIGAYGCPMLVRPRPFVATLFSRHDDAKADATRPGPISDSQPTKRDRERAWERAWERASSPKTSSILKTAILAEGASTVGYIPSDAKRERAPRRDARVDRYIPDLSLATVSPADAEAVSLAPGEHLSCELDLGFRDAALVVGCTPPPSRYFGVTPHLYREYLDGVSETTLKPLGDSLSYGVGPPRAGQSPGQSSPAARYTRLSTQARKVGTNWYANDARAVVRDDATECSGKTFAVLVGRSRHTMAAAMDALEAAGVVNDTAVNPYGLSSPGGDDGEERTHAVLLANAGPFDRTEWDAYARSPPFVVTRLTPRHPTLFDPFHAVDWTDHGHHPGEFPEAGRIARARVDERGLAPAVAAVAAKIANAFDAGEYRTRVSESPRWGISDSDISISGDVTLVRGPSFVLPTDGSKDVYVVGVDRSRSGSATYSSVSLAPFASTDGFVHPTGSFADDSTYGGTAARWGALAGVAAEDAGAMYVVKLAVRCPEGIVDGEGVVCVEASASSSTRFVVEERAYAHPDATTGPERRNLAAPVIVEVTRASREVVGPGGSGFGASWFRRRR